MTTRNKFSPEVRERAVRMVGEHRTLPILMGGWWVNFQVGSLGSRFRALKP